MNLQVELLEALELLPCFDELLSIELLANGLSQTSIKVTTKSKLYFAKKLNSDTANIEISCALFCSNNNSKEDLTTQLSPAVVYHDQQWLVTEFISDYTLADAKVGLDVKNSITLTLMAKLHQLSTSRILGNIPQLNTSLSVARLLTKPLPLLAKNISILDSVSKTLTDVISKIILASESPLVLCHGDMNFSNILIDYLQNPRLIDFECAHKAPPEFDLAMFIAVNSVPTNRIKGLVIEYTELNPAHDCNDELLNLYILYSFFINGLWYLDNMDKNEESKLRFQELAFSQWSSFDNFADELNLQLSKLLPLLN